MNLSSRQLFVGAMLVSALLLTWIKVELNHRLSMASTHTHFTEAVHIARNSIKLPAASRGVQLTSQGVATIGGSPTNTGAWIARFSEHSSLAPGGGPAYVVTREGNFRTGAIGVSATNYGSEIHISRPEYLDLRAQRAVITATDLIYEGTSS